jgi:hypothetical protein
MPGQWCSIEMETASRLGGTLSSVKTYYLNPTMTLNTLSTPSILDKPALRRHPNTPQHRAARQIADQLVPIARASPDAIALAAPIPARSLPPRQPLPTPVLYPDKSSIKLGLDVHVEFIMFPTTHQGRGNGSQYGRGSYRSTNATARRHARCGCGSSLAPIVWWPRC